MLILAIPEIFIDMKIIFGLFFGIIAPFYFYKALRNFYKQSRLKTIIKFVILNVVFIIGATVAASLFFVATAATY
jgi:multisubunit Na+/H+ antiporter MnhE subunit